MKKIFLLLIILMFTTLCTCSCLKSNLETNNSEEDLDYSSLEDLNMPKDDITLKIDGQSLNLETPIYLEKNRYYLCLNDVIDKLDGKLNISNDILKLKVLNEDITIDTENNKIILDSNEFNLKKQLIKNKKFYYIGFSDFSNMLNLYTRWDVNNKTISCKTNGDSIDNVKPYVSTLNQKGYLRLEDIALTTLPDDNDYLEKLRIIGNYLAKKNIPYHAAWIPRYVCPANNIDVDPLSRNDFQTAQLVYTLDYLTYHKCLIGLHGYTHQEGNEESAVGVEFGPKFPSVSNFEERIQKAFDTAKYLDIPIEFFEAPHYEITEQQNIAAEKYFKILYHPFKDNGPSGIDCTKPQLSPHNNKSYYLSAYLDYVHDNGENAFIKKIQNADIKYMGSMFFHPRLDFKHISLSDNNGIPEYTYDDNSILKRIVDALEKKGYKMSSVKEIV